MVVTILLVATFFTLYYKGIMTGPVATFWFFVIKGTISTTLMVVGGVWAWKRTRSKPRSLFLKRRRSPSWLKGLAVIVVLLVVAFFARKPQHTHEQAVTKSSRITVPSERPERTPSPVIATCDDDNDE